MRISDWSSDVCSSDLLISSVSAVSNKSPRSAMTCIRRPSRVAMVFASTRSEERRVGKGVSVRVDLGGRRIIKKKRRYKILDNRINYTRRNKRYNRNIDYQHYKRSPKN